MTDETENASAEVQEAVQEAPASEDAKGETNQDVTAGEGIQGEEEEEEGEEEELEAFEVEIEPEEEQLEEEPFISIFEILDAPRELPEPIDLTLDIVKQIQSELGIITLCWPDIKDPQFEKRVNFPESYVKNTNKEKLLLLYAENFRRQFIKKFPHRKPLFLASPNEVGLTVSFLNFNQLMSSLEANVIKDTFS